MAAQPQTEPVEYHYGKFPPRELDYARLLDPVSEATAALARYDQMLAGMKNSEILLAPLRNQEAVVSSRMEGTISTLDEVLKIAADTDDSADESVFRQARSEAVETYLHSRAMQRLQRQMEDGQPLSEFMIRGAHQILLSFGRGAEMSPGSYKSEQNYIGEKRNRTVSFVPISPESLPFAMQQLMEFVQSSPMNSLLKAAIAHVEFEALHPFKDGNGRIGRMLITLMLWQYRIIRQPHFYVSSYFEELREEYIDAMRKVSATGAWTDWCIFFLRGLTEQANRNILIAQRIFGLYDGTKVRFRQILNSPWSVDAVDFMFANPVFRNSKFTGQKIIPSHVAMTMTRKLREAGLISEVSPSSGRRPALYAFTPLLDIVQNR